MTINQRRVWSSIVSVLVCFVVVFTIHYTQEQTRHTFGYPAVVKWAVTLLLYGMVVTHTFLAAIMLMQRQRWTPSEAAMFRFIGTKAIFWLFFSVQFRMSSQGIYIDLLAMWVVMAVATIDLDVRLFGRYVLGWEDAEMENRFDQDDAELISKVYDTDDGKPEGDKPGEEFAV
jgi:ABC-type xylose transport system permease subunit